MTLEDTGRAILFIDLVAVCAFLVLAWRELRDQTTDLGKVGGVLAIAALCFVIYWVGRALLGL